MRIFLCRDSAEGILTGVYDAWASRLGHANVRLALAGTGNMELFAEYQMVPEDRDKAEKVMRTLRRRLVRTDFESVFQALYAADDNRADSIYRVIVFALYHSGTVMDNLENPSICHIFQLARKTANEAHRYLQFLRFRELQNGALFAEISPENQVLSLIGDHFANRLPMENFVIYDNRHDVCLFHGAGKAWVLMDVPEKPDTANLRWSEGEYEMKANWQAFFEHVAVMERRNQRLQKQFLPLKFRTYMTENFRDNSESDKKSSTGI